MMAYTSGTSGNVLTPYKVAGIDGNIKEVIANNNTVYVLTDTGLYAWGDNRRGQVGNGTSGAIVRIPHKVKGIDGNIKEVIVNYKDLYANDKTVYVLTDTGLYAWGYNSYGQVGNGTTDRVLTPHKVKGIEGNIKEIVYYNNGTVYVLTDTGLYAWGSNGFGEVGNGTIDNVLTPYKAVNGNIKEIVYNNRTVYVLTDDGLYAWGYNKYGQVGNGKTESIRTPHKAEGIEGNIKEVIVNNNTVYVLTDTGLYAWGDNYRGKVGNGTTANVLTPYKVEGIDGNIKEVIFNGLTVYVLTDTGLYAWGYNFYGQVGNGTTDNVLTPYKVEGIGGNIKDVITTYGGYTVYVITDTGLYAWGRNKYGQVGNGTTEDVLTPYKVQIEKQN